MKLFMGLYLSTPHDYYKSLDHLREYKPALVHSDSLFRNLSMSAFTPLGETNLSFKVEWYVSFLNPPKWIYSIISSNPVCHCSCPLTELVWGVPLNNVNVPSAGSSISETFCHILFPPWTDSLAHCKTWGRLMSLLWNLSQKAAAPVQSWK